MGDTSIQWTTKTWNPTRGCSLVSPGCTNCYAMKQAHRFSGKGGPYEGLTKLRSSGGPVWTGEMRFAPEMLEAPLRWKRPAKVFVNSMSDLFHEGVTDGQIMDVWRIMGNCQQHTFQILTKRAERMRAWLSKWADVESGDTDPVMARGPAAIRSAHQSGRARLFADMIEGWGAPPGAAAYPTYDWMQGQRWWPTVLPNVHLGVSVESQRYAAERIPHLLATPAAVRWVSAEPLIEGVDLSRYLAGEGYERNAAGEMAERHGPYLDWVVIGGESGPGARPFCISWAMNIVADCEEAGTACFVKQLGAHPYRVSDDAEDLDVYDAAAVAEWYRLKDRKGGTMSEWPSDYLRKREFPEAFDHSMSVNKDRS